ncbi:MAG: 50S ribosomal protein L10 [Candidatus Tagabacteria bacterium RIFCSPLOWO2_01_FULL_39_11]|uniref:Large ribosomal subunit protein uL10 n=1 Tax=Candidatus Tagabacteria bacterium RIFCSPLOWO2_01_FULL_39_11 TaxID=1802295 RepID=A0A1G2LR09_9BACT|nr:MAG: 50S ribosomal protein L10 [Candidatus Tagabacteria bacterium RIFCSPLOWO2_01_FULL_39_11]
MALTKEKKGTIIQDVREKIKNSNIVVFLNFHGLNVGSISTLRNKLRADNSFYKVAKKTLVKKAVDNFKFEGELPALTGELAVVFGSDEIRSPKTLTDFIKHYVEKPGTGGKKCLEILGGILDKKFINKNSILALSRIPSREILLSRLLNSFNAPARQMVGVLAGTMRGFIGVLKQIEKNKL